MDNRDPQKLGVKLLLLRNKTKDRRTYHTLSEVYDTHPKSMNNVPDFKDPPNKKASVNGHKPN